MIKNDTKKRVEGLDFLYDDVISIEYNEKDKQLVMKLKHITEFSTSGLHKEDIMVELLLQFNGVQNSQIIPKVQFLDIVEWNLSYDKDKLLFLFRIANGDKTSKNLSIISLNIICREFRLVKTNN